MDLILQILKIALLPLAVAIATGASTYLLPLLVETVRQRSRKGRRCESIEFAERKLKYVNLWLDTRKSIESQTSLDASFTDVSDEMESDLTTTLKNFDTLDQNKVRSKKASPNLFQKFALLYKANGHFGLIAHIGFFATIGWTMMIVRLSIISKPEEGQTPTEVADVLGLLIILSLIMILIFWIAAQIARHLSK